MILDGYLRDGIEWSDCPSLCHSLSNLLQFLISSFLIHCFVFVIVSSKLCSILMVVELLCYAVMMQAQIGTDAMSKVYSCLNYGSVCHNTNKILVFNAFSFFSCKNVRIYLLGKISGLPLIVNLLNCRATEE